MADDEDRGRGIGRMTTKQKVTIGALVVIVLVIIWQVMGLFESSTPTPSPAVAPQPSAAPMSTAAPGVPASVPPQVPAQPTVPTPTQVPQGMEEQATLHQTPITLENKMLEAQQSSEVKYIEQINQLQLLKVQREIAETNQAIASARLATVTAEKNVSDLLTKPSQPIAPDTGPPLPPSAYSAALVAPALEGTQLISPPTQQPPPPPVPLEIPYVVISVSMQLGKWNAVMGHGGKLYNVTVGDVLPEDNSIVSSINKNGVVLTSSKGKRRKISILTSI